MYLKRMLKTCRIQILDEKVFFFEKEPFLKIILIFFCKWGILRYQNEKKSIEIFLKFKKKFLKNSFTGTWQISKETKS